MHRSAIPPGFSRYRSWQFEHAVVMASAASSILSLLFAWAALYEAIPASRSPWTNFSQSGFFTGTARPFEQTRPGIVRRFAASASARELFSTAAHPPKVPDSGSVAREGSPADLTSAGFLS